MKITAVFVLVASMLIASGCASIPDEVKTKVSTEMAVHDGYVRVIKEGVKLPDGTTRPVTAEEFTKMVLKSRKAWYAMGHYCTDTPAPDDSFDSLSTVKLGGK